MASKDIHTPTNTTVNSVMPDLNRRVRMLVAHFADGNVSRFVKLLNENNHGEEVSQQKFNRIFNIDPRTKKYPGVPTSVTTAITNKFVELNPKWLLNGEGEMFLTGGKVSPADDSFNWERAAIKALSWGLANALSEISELKGKRRDPEAYLEEIDRSTNMILHDQRRSDKERDLG